MKTKLFSIVAIFAVVLFSVGCDDAYFPKTGTGDWTGTTRVSILRAGVAEEVTATLTLRLRQDDNSQMLFTRYPAITINDTALAVAPADARPLSVVTLSGVSGDSTFDVRGRNANVNTFILSIPQKNFSGGVVMPVIAFSGRYVDDNTIEGTISQTVTPTGQPSRVVTSTLRIAK